jgi:hypothetical protein
VPRPPSPSQFLQGMGSSLYGGGYNSYGGGYGGGM